MDLFIKTISFVYSEYHSLIRLYYSSSYLIDNLIFGLIKCYFKYFQIKGRSFRYLLMHSILILKFGYSHKLYYQLPNNTVLTLINKQVLKISGKVRQVVIDFFFKIANSPMSIFIEVLKCRNLSTFFFTREVLVFFPYFIIEISLAKDY